jgi:peptidoglycan/LPS O-acetylase OafA/YrhL
VTEATSGGSPFVAGLDGLRALAVVVVLAFHLQLSGATGGFLGVSLFFTLSGYLITQLMLRERAEHGRIDVVAFWVRRLRRLMPAAVVVIGAIAVAAIVFDRFPSERLRGDLFAALGYAANWRFMSGSTSYADLFTSTPSPVLHFWSLAIEEQFYVIYPVVMAGLLAVRRRWALPVGLGVLTAASLMVGLITSDQDIVYYGAHTRAAEILAGTLLALWLPLGGGSGTGIRGARLLASPLVNTAVFGSSLIGFIALVVTVETGDPWLYSGGFAAVSLLSILLIIGVQSPGPVRWLAERPLAVRIGGLSYGLYLFHWPIFLLVTETSTSLSGWSLHVVRLAITALVAWVSSTCLEQPIRRRKILGSPRSSRGALIGAVVAYVIAISFVPRTPAQVLAGLDAPEGFVNFADGETRPALGIAVLGSDPTAANRLSEALGDAYTLDIVDESDPDCPLGPREGCVDPSLLLGDVLRTHRPDIVVSVLGPLDREAVLSALVDAGETNVPGTAPSDASPDDAAFFAATQAYVNDIVGRAPTTPMLFIDTGASGPATTGAGQPDVMTAYLEDAALRLANVSALVDPSATDIVREVALIRSVAAGDDDRRRVMVIGDSTSYGVSVAIDRLDGERINVLWAGGQNCPLVEVAAVKWWEGVEFDLQRCPTIDAEWRTAFDSFAPDVVVIAVSVPEQADQKYVDDPEWHAPGSATYEQRHDAFIEAFMNETSSRGIDVMILDSPTIHGGALGGAPFSSPERVVLWNAVITRWSEMWPDVVVVPWAAAMTAFEPTPGALRGDGVHLLQDDLDDLVAQAILPVLGERLFGGVDGVGGVGGSAVEAETQPVQ